jgi:alginate O-acetyltransferase complex protein AlgJ
MTCGWLSFFWHPSHQPQMLPSSPESMGRFSMTKTAKIYSGIFSVLFFSILLVQLFIPDFSLDSLSEKFLLRMTLIKEFNAFRYAVGDTIFNGGLVGKDGWLYYTGDYSIHDYQKTELMGLSRLEYFGELLNKLNQSTAQNGGKMWLMIPPDKNTIYPQYMPDEIPVIGQSSRLDQLTDYLQKKTEINLLDLHPLFTDVAKSSQIYYKSDAHWNCLGAYYGSNELLAQVSALHPQVQTHPLTDYEFGTMSDSTLDIAGVMGLKLQEETVTLTPKFPIGSISYESYDGSDAIKVATNSQTDLPTALVIHDSFYPECLNQFLEPQFSRVIFSHYEKMKFSDYLKLIETEKPDVVIVEFAERHIEYFFRLMTTES